MKTCKALYFIGCWFVLAASLYGEVRHPIQPKDLVRIRPISNPQISQDGKLVVFEVLEPGGVEAPDWSGNKDIWLVPTDGGCPPRKYVFGPGMEYLPQWSPDGKYLGFLSNRGREHTTQIYLLPTSGGEAERLTQFNGDVLDFQWLPNSSGIAFTAQEKSTPAQAKQYKAGFDAYVVGENLKFARLYELELMTRTIKPISRPDEQVNAFDYAPTGDRIALNISSSPEPDAVNFHAQLVIINRDGSKRKIISGKDRGFALDHCLKTPHWSPDGRQVLYFVPVGTSYLPAIVEMKTGKARILAEQYRGTIWYMDWNPETRAVLVSAQQGVQGIFGQLDLQTGTVKVIKKVGRSYSEVQNWSLSADGKWVAFQDASAYSPDDIWLMKTDGSQVRRLTRMNPHVDSLQIGLQEVVRWKGKDDWEIEGILIKPVGYMPGKRYPLVVEIHGGPTWAWWNGWLANWHEWAQLLANNGLAVLFPNPRGSNGYGLEFARANFNDWGGRDFEDVMCGIDYLVAIGIADSTRLGIGGWSYGGFMTAWAITQTHRFKAAVMGAAVTDLKTMYSSCGRPENFRIFFRGNPFGEREPIYRAHSPVTFVAQAKTPTLILHGENDSVVPISQSYEFYQGLKDMGVVTKFVLYPREGHGISEPAHQQDLMNRMLKWFSHYLKDEK